MNRWIDLAARMQADGETCANSANSAKTPPDRIEPAPIGPNDTVGTVSFPADVVVGLKALQAMAAPRIARPEIWPGVVADAFRLTSEGWAAQALSLGWTPLDLWGCSPVARGNPDHEGLAVWLDGRRILLLDERTCIVDAGAGARAVFTRREPAVGALLWDLGKAAC